MAELSGDAYTQSLCEEPRLTYRPELFLLAPFLASAPFYQPNAGVFALLAPQGFPLGACGMAGVAAALLTALAMLVRSAGEPGWRGPGRRVERLGVACYALTQVACPALLWTGLANVGLIGALSAVAGVAAVPVVVAWVRRFCLDFRSVVFYGSVDCLAASAAIWALSGLPTPFALVCMPVMAVVGSVAVLAVPEPDGCAAGAGCTAEGLGERLRNLFAEEWLCLLGLFVCCLMMGMFELSINDAASKSECMGGILAAAIALVACVAQRRTPLVILIERLVIPLVVAVCFFLRGFPDQSPLFYAGAMSVYTPLMLVALFAIASAAAFAHSGDFPLPLVTAVLLALTCAGTLLGRAYRGVAFTDEMNMGQQSWLVACAFFMVVIGELAFFTWRKLVDARSDAVLPAGEGASSQAEQGDYGPKWERRLDELAEEGGLTAREREMLAYVSRGYGSTFISKKLFISPSTVRTHVKHLYAKLDVNSREALIAKVEGMGE